MPAQALFTSFLPLQLKTMASLRNGLNCGRLIRPHLQPKSITTFASSQSKLKDVTESAEGDNSREKPEPSAQDTSQKMVRAQYIDKKSLVWDKRYKSVEDVPEMLPYQTIVQARNRFRIRANLVMIGLTVMAALAMVYTGKERARAGDTVEKRTLERHRQLRAQKAEEDRVAQAAATSADK
ncbi:UPF0389 protein GA21628-like isoform X2 [Amphibalanus amphitrite]|uniref:UPF0389 protein GA21628-like isoform X2 n=2 Tax=Amphibalanus amphitrite TaxID=1232801 RepID=UPI001C8FBE08|nr:UPF0389 protein GA21628-like isoform X2 [Amphibalanus amphitrite]